MSEPGPSQRRWLSFASRLVAALVGAVALGLASYQIARMADVDPYAPVMVGAMLGFGGGVAFGWQIAALPGA